jgi:hypothetical protein
VVAKGHHSTTEHLARKRPLRHQVSRIARFSKDLGASGIGLGETRSAKMYQEGGQATSMNHWGEVSSDDSKHDKGKGLIENALKTENPHVH